MQSMLIITDINISDVAAGKCVCVRGGVKHAALHIYRLTENVFILLYT